MTFDSTLISHAPNFEDVLLWRALGHLDTGYYLDVGAADPLDGSVTAAFYQRGWRGINLEPVPALHARLCAARPADLNLAAAAGAAAGRLRLFERLDGAQASSDAARALAWRGAGHDVLQREVDSLTLDQVCERHVGGALHFLNLAVAGAAPDVLAGLDLRRWRPWIVLVAADQPEGWAAPLLAAGYRHAYQDGHKTYYVAGEHPQLLAALALPPHPDDRYTLVEGHRLAWPLAQWRQRTASAEQEAREARDWAAARARELDERALRAETALGELATLERASAGRAEALEQQLQACQVRAAEAEQLAAQGLRAAAELRGIYGSVAWRLARPIRGMVKLAKFALALLRRARARLAWLYGRARERLARLRRGLRPALMALPKAALAFVTARPALAYFLRRQLGRSPRLVALLRTVAMRLKAPPPPAASAAADTELQQLSPAARQVFDQLQRALRHSRHS